ncbi:MAG: hypothetical protein ACXWF8_02145 [Methylobacter sp.]
MSSHDADKQRHAINAVKTALSSAGINERTVYLQVDRHAGLAETDENYSVFVSAPAGANIEPFYITGKSLVEVVKQMLCSIKTTKSGVESGLSEAAPF